MSGSNGPERLSRSAEYEELFRRARATSWTPERLAHNRALLDAQLAVLAAPVAAAPAVTLTAGKLASAGLVAALVVVGGAVVLTRNAAPPATSAAPSEAVEAVEAGDAGEVEEHATEVVVGPALAPLPSARKRAAPPPPTLEASSAGGEVDEQVRLLGMAREQAGRGQHGAALAVLDGLVRRHPGGALLVEATLLRVTILTAAGRIDEALPLALSLIADDDYASSRAKLLRLVGDLHHQRGACEPARAAYRRALGLGLSAEEAKLAQRGIKACAEP